MFFDDLVSQAGVYFSLLWMQGFGTLAEKLFETANDNFIFS